MSETTAKLKRQAAAKVLMPVVATLASAAASYLAKKGPQYIEQLMPKAKETTGGAADGAASMDELEQRRRERAEHRAARQKAS